MAFGFLMAGITDVVSKGEDMQFSTSELTNDSTSIYYAKETNSKTDGNAYFTIGSNNGSTYTLGMENSPASMKERTMTFNLTSYLWEGKQLTVNNIQNAAAHEGNGHFKNGVPGDGVGHAGAYQMQINHSSWKGTTPEWKKGIQKALIKVQNGIID